MESEPDVTEKVERTDVGFRLTVESTRGTGTRDQDKVKAEARTETRYELEAARKDLRDSVMATLSSLRAHQPDEDGEEE